MLKGNTICTFSALGFGASLSLSAHAQSLWEKPATPPPPHERQAPPVERHLKVFDNLDFDVISNQKWDRLKESHAEDIVVTWPDGHETKGIAKQDLKALFVFALDLRIKEHPIRFGIMDVRDRRDEWNIHKTHANPRW